MTKPDDDTAIVTVHAEIEEIPGQRADVQDSEEPIEVGFWYWIKEKDDKDESWLACVIQVGSNYVEVSSTHEGTTRIHFNKFDSVATREPNAEAVIKGKIGHYQDEVNRLLGRVKEVTAQLAINTNPALPGASETQALALRGAEQPDMKEYGAALVKAKEETLPDLFKQVEKANKSLATWMTAQVIPLKAQARGLKKTIGAIDDRIFSVELYAGLVETVEKIQDGDPAQLGDKIHLIQRLCYMDEECLAQYRTGGMTLENLEDFDAWLLEPENLERILPFTRCVVSFRVRRFEKRREMPNLSAFLRILEEKEQDKFTFLYIRNGQQVFRMRTGIEFGEKLFPDMDRASLGGKLWAEMFAGDVKGLITDHDYQEREKTYKRELAAFKVREKAYKEALKTPEAKRRAKEKKLRHGPDASCVDVPWPGMEPYRSWNTFVPYNRSTVYYDDITAKIQSEIKEHNRIALILQGLLDRSPVLHPHPPWQIWTEAGFQAAFTLIYDDSRALVAGEKPDFEAYRARLNKHLLVGSITVGQEDAWLRAEAEKENDRRDRDYRWKGEYRPTHFRPDGDPGPGMLARVARHSRGNGKVTYEWIRQRRRSYSDEDKVKATFTTDVKRVLNVDAYKPGDFKQFFNDPRTRAEYLKWAPLLLEAEEYHAGNRKVEPLKPLPTAPKKAPSWENQVKYARQKRTKAAIKMYLHKCVRTKHDIETKGGIKYPKGTLWRVTGHDRAGEFRISQIDETGRLLGGSVHHVEHTGTFELVEFIPEPPEEKTVEEPEDDVTDTDDEDLDDEDLDDEEEEEEEEEDDEAGDGDELSEEEDLDEGEDEDFDEDDEEEDDDE
jgi:hypothetical protein